MSKKTNALKHARRVAPHRPRKRRGGRLNPAFPVVIPQSVVGSLIDTAIGGAFVEFLRAAGLRDKIVEIVFSADGPETSEGPA